MTPQDYRSLDALAIADLVARRQVSAVEACDAAIGSIETLNPGLECRGSDPLRCSAGRGGADRR